MSIAETHRNRAEILRAAGLERVKAGPRFIAPWRIDADQDNAVNGLEECGCGFCPDDDGTDSI